MLNLNELSRNSAAARIITASAMYNPAEQIEKFNFIHKNSLQQRIDPMSEKTKMDIINRFGDVLEKSLFVLVDRIAIKLENSLDKLLGNSSQEKIPAELEGQQMNNQQQNNICTCGEINNKITSLSNISNSDTKVAKEENTLLNDGLSALTLGGGLLGFDGIKDLFEGLYKSAKKFFKKPTNFLKKIFSGGIFSGAAKVLGGLF